MFNITAKIKYYLKKFINKKLSSLVNINILVWNIKLLMAEKAKKKIENYISKLDTPVKPEFIGITSKITTQEDMESPWCRYWINQLKIDFRYHRKLWEYAFVLQALYENGMFGKEGLGLACGHEPIPSYLISKGCKITAGDKPADIKDKIQNEWRKTGQYAEKEDDLYDPRLLCRDEFFKNFTCEYIDMNNLKKDAFGKFDFVWSICAVEHLGSIDAGLNFLTNSLSLLKPGGISIHTMEYNIFSDTSTFESNSLSLFRKCDIEKLGRVLLESKKAELLSFNDDSSNFLFDKYIDMPPYDMNSNTMSAVNCNLVNDLQIPHLRLILNEYPSTCAGVIIRKF